MTVRDDFKWASTFTDQYATKHFESTRKAKVIINTRYEISWVVKGHFNALFSVSDLQSRQKRMNNI